MSITNGHDTLLDMEAHLAPYLEAIAALPFVQKIALSKSPARGEVDGFLKLKTRSGHVVTLPFEHKRSHLSRALGEQLITLSRRHPDLLVLAPMVGRNLARLFTEQGVNFIDLAGNCYLRIGDRFLANVQGQRAPARPARDKALRAPALRVLLALLMDRELVQGTTREIAGAAGNVSPQTASHVLERLVSSGAIVRSLRNTRWLPRGRALALGLVISGLPALVSAVLVGRYRGRPVPLEALELELAKGLGASPITWRWGGGAAASRLTGFYRGERTLIYLDTNLHGLPRQLKLVPDPMGPVTLLVSPGLAAFSSPDKTTVHPLLVYLDLLGEENDRAREAAAELHERYLTELLA